jgi:hypothetical protein
VDQAARQSEFSRLRSVTGEQPASSGVIADAVQLGAQEI